MTPLDSLELKLTKVEYLIDSVLSDMANVKGAMMLDLNGEIDWRRTKGFRKSISSSQAQQLRFLYQCKALLDKKILALKKGKATDDH